MYLHLPVVDEMQPEIVSKVSKAGLGLCLWVRAMDVYSDVAKEVGPKKARLEEMNAQLGKTSLFLHQESPWHTLDTTFQ